ADIGVFLAVLVDDHLLGLDDLVDRIGDFEIEHLRRFLQPFGVLLGLEDLAAIGALAFENAARIMQAVREHVQVGVLPGDEFAVVPDDPFEAVVGLCCHVTSPYSSPRRSFLSRLPLSWRILSAQSNTLRRRATPVMIRSDPALISSNERSRYDHFVCNALFVT